MNSLAGVSSAFVAQHQVWVRKQAQALVRHLPANVERADLVQVGLIAVAQCAVSFEDTGEPDAFQRYARQRVKGAMLDELRGMDFLSRGERRNVKRVIAARERFAAERGRVAAPSDLAAATGLPGAEVQQLLAADAAGRSASDAENDDARNDPATAADHVEAQVDDRLTMRRLTEFMAAQPHASRAVVDAYIGVGPSPIETARALGVTPSRVSQIYGATLARMRQALHGKEPAPVEAIAEPEPPIVVYRAPPVRPERRVSFDPVVLDIFAADIVSGCGAELLR